MSEEMKDTVTKDSQGEKEIQIHKEHRHHHHHKKRTKKEKLNRFFKKHKISISIVTSVICLLFIAVVLIVNNIQNASSGTLPAGNSGSDTTGVSDSRNPDEPLYSFGVLSDLHLQKGKGSSGGVEDFRRALTYLKERVSFTCIVGDMVDFAGYGDVEYFGTDDYMEQYKKCIEQYADNMPIYECAGNHETYLNEDASGSINIDAWKVTTGKELYYSFVRGEDIFIFLGIQKADKNNIFSAESLKWLEQTLEMNKNKRCFVFQHCPDPADKTGDPSGKWLTFMDGAPGNKFISLMKKYKNVVWFHGHTHLTLGIDLYPVSDTLGYKSVHVPSLVAPRFYDAETGTLQDYYIDGEGHKISSELFSEGYVVDVYENKIIVRGINFAAGINGEQVEEMYEDAYVLNTTIRILK